MSFDVTLEQDGHIVQVDRHAEGGVYAMGGTTVADLNITYNYSPFYYQHLNKEEGLRWLNGKRAFDVISALNRAVTLLGITQADDYWAATPGNAGYALSILLKWARQHPEAIFKVE